MNYWKIPRAWAYILGLTKSTLKLPDGWYLIRAWEAVELRFILLKEFGEKVDFTVEALESIGAISLSVEEAKACKKGELLHCQQTIAIKTNQ